MGRDASNKGAFQKPPKKSQAPIDNYRRRLGKYNPPNNTVGDDYPCLQTKPFWGAKTRFDSQIRWDRRRQRGLNLVVDPTFPPLPNSQVHGGQYEL